MNPYCESASNGSFVPHHGDVSIDMDTKKAIFWSKYRHKNHILRFFDRLKIGETECDVILTLSSFFDEIFRSKLRNISLPVDKYFYPSVVYSDHVTKVCVIDWQKGQWERGSMTSQEVVPNNMQSQNSPTGRWLKKIPGNPCVRHRCSLTI